MKIAIIGSGISGLTCAWYLAHEHQITLYEANHYVGGHTATVDVNIGHQSLAVDSGFIVYNDRTYPHFIELLSELGIQGQPTEMSFSVSNGDTGLEYNGNSLNSLFAQRKNLFSPRFYYFLYEIVRFNKLCKQSLRQGVEDHLTLADFLNQHHFSDFFALHYILPMGAAIWSSSLADMRSFPLGFFLRFFENHGLLDITNRPQWFVIPGGSREYVRQILQRLGDLLTVYLDTPVSSVSRHQQGVTIVSNKGSLDYDAVIFACHSDQALALLADASRDETDILQAQPYQANKVIMHTDTTLLPKQPRAWASWNYLLPITNHVEQAQASVTYDMNILQQLPCPKTLCVSLNPQLPIASQKILASFTYHHPVFNQTSRQAQQKRQLINGVQNTWYCGAYWYNGFHEDGVKSALDIVNKLRNPDDK